MADRYEYYITGDDTTEGPYGVQWRGQSFTPATAHRITSVKLLLARKGSPGTVTVGIRATSGGHPTGDDLCSGTIDGNTLTTTTTGNWYEITFGAGVILNADTQYVIVVRAPAGDVNNFVYMRIDSSTPTYGGGCLEYSTNSGGSWTTYTGYDYMFEDWGEPPVVAPTVTTQAVDGIGFD